MAVRGLSGFVSSYCLSWVSGNVVMQMRRSIFHHFMHMPVTFFDKEPTGSLLSRITYDSEQVSGATSRALVSIVREVQALSVLRVLEQLATFVSTIVVAPIVCFVIVSFLSVSARFLKYANHDG